MCDSDTADPAETPDAGPDDAVAWLRAEHRLLLAVLDAVAREARTLRDGGPVREQLWRAIVDFLSDFGDAVHRAREEDILFPAMVEAGFPFADGPLAEMRQEHADCRSRVAALGAALAAGDPARLWRAAAACAELERRHIVREDEVLLAIADQILTPRAASRVLADFRRFDAVALGVDGARRVVELARWSCHETGVEFSWPLAQGATSPDSEPNRQSKPDRQD